MKTKIPVSYVIIACCVTLLMSSCAGKKSVGNTAEGEVKLLSCIVVMPTRTPVVTTNSITYTEAEELERGAKFVESVLAEKLNGSQVPRIIAASNVEGVVTEVAGGNVGMMRFVAQELNCKSLLVSKVLKYKQRNGGEYSVDSPASVALEMQIFDVDRNSILWSSTFNETQQTLLSNIFSFTKAQSRGFKWISVEELTRQGINERLTECPFL